MAKFISQLSKYVNSLRFSEKAILLFYICLYIWEVIYILTIPK